MKKYSLFDIYHDKDDIKSISKVIERGSYWAAGPEIMDFEQSLAKYFDVKFVVTFNSGTSALHALLLAYGITSGEVIVPSFTFISTANCVVLAGAKPVFAEIEEDSLSLDIIDVKRKINKNTRAIIPVHYGGKPCKNIFELKKIAAEHNILLIEDNAESFGAKIGDNFVGTIGDSSMISFCQNKILPTGEGGAIITNSKDIAEKLKLIRSHGRVENPDIDYFSNIDVSDYIEIGYNYRLPTILAALGLSQLFKIEKIISLRRKIGTYYDERLSEIKEIQVFMKDVNNFCVYQLYTIILKDPKNRKELQDFLLKNGIYTKIYFSPVHLKSFYRNKYGFREGDLPITESISKRVLTIPMSLNFSEEDQDFIVGKIAEFFENK